MIKAFRFLAVFFVAIFVGFGFSVSHARAGYFDYSDVLLIVNDNSATSTTIGNYYANARGIASTSVIHLSTVTSEGVTRTEFTNNIRTPIENFITSRGIATTTNYLVTTKGVPLMLNDTGDSVESELGLILGPYSTHIGTSETLSNPYYNATVRFSRAAYGVYMVTRLDGYTIAGVESMIDRSANATTTNAGSFVLDVEPGYDGAPGYKPFNDYMRAATTSLIARGYNVILDQTTTYLTYQSNVLGYISWGSNDGHATTTNSIPHNTYVNGALGDTGVSTSARSFKQGTTYGQSLIADWLDEGISAMKGYVSEPYVSALSHADILFDRYTSGYTMADSFLAAAQQINWKDEYIGDPKMIIVKTPIPFEVASPANNTVSATQSPVFTWSASDGYYGISKYQLYIDGILNKDNIIGTSTTPTSDLSAGTHTWYVKAVDGVGGAVNSTSTFTVNIVPGYVTGYTFYVDNVLGNNNNPGTQALPWATLTKANAIVVSGDTVVIIKNTGVPYRETLLPVRSGTSALPITFRGIDSSHKPEIWGSTDISSGWSVYGGGNPDTYQYATTTNVKVLAMGPSITSLTKKTLGTAAATLNSGEWFWVSNVLYYRLAAGETMGTLHIEASIRNYGTQSTSYTSYQDIIVRYANSYGVYLTGASASAQRIEVYDSSYGIFSGGNTNVISYCITARNRNYGIYLNFPIGSTVSNSIAYGNSVGGVRIVTLSGTTATLKNNIFAGNGGFSISFNIIIAGALIASSYNLWDIAGDTSWNGYKGGSNLELVDPLFVATSTSNFALSPFSPAIDAGTTISGLTTDILGNPLYGTPDIGAYEYQRPYSIGAQKISSGGSVRLYADGGYRYTTATSSDHVADLGITPVGGFNGGGTGEWMNVTVSMWQTTAPYNKQWTENSSIATSTVHTIGDLAADSYYKISLDGTQYEILKSDAGGRLNFTYSAGYSTHTFLVEPAVIGNGPPIAISTPVTAFYIPTESQVVPSVPIMATTTPIVATTTPSQVTPEKKPSPQIFTRTLKRGSRGADVRVLQELLKKDPNIYPEGVVNGSFGPATERALKRFQKKYRIAAPGVVGYGLVGPKTRKALQSLGE